MGNKFTRRRAVVDERYTRVQGLYQHKDLDPRKLRRLILSGQLAPCFPGAENAATELDECPICFLFYPSLNRSKCCAKGICTECYLQIKSPHLARPLQCPFCKTSTYVVEYRGPKSVEEKGIEEAEEQKVIEAKIRIRQQELHVEKERLRRFQEGLEDDGVPPVIDRFRHNFTNLHGFTLPPNNADEFESGEHDSQAVDASSSADQTVLSSQSEEFAHQIPTIARPSLSTPTMRSLASSFHRSNRDDEFDLGLEDIMVMEAIWLSIQEQKQTQNELSPTQQGSLGMASNSRNMTNDNSCSSNCGNTTEAQESNESRNITTRKSVTGGLAGAIAALAERQVVLPDGQGHDNHQDHDDDQQSLENDRNSIGLTGVLTSNTPPIRGPGQRDLAEGESEQNHISSSRELSNWIERSIENEEAISPQIHGEGQSSVNDWVLDHSSEVVEVGTSFSSSVPSASDLPWEAPEILSGTHSVENVNTLAPVIAVDPMLPQSFEEQMMLAMALSLAEAQTQSRR